MRSKGQRQAVRVICALPNTSLEPTRLSRVVGGIEEPEPPGGSASSVRPPSWDTGGLL